MEQYVFKIELRIPSVLVQVSIERPEGKASESYKGLEARLHVILRPRIIYP